VFSRIFDVQRVTGQLVVPDSMVDWVKERFGGVSAVERQEVVKVTNLITLEGALFNALRGVRPTDGASNEDVQAAIESTRGGPFCQPEQLTPEDVFGDRRSGRIRGKHCVTASNVAKYDGYHGLIVFDEHNPLLFTRERVHDYVNTALRWARRAHNADTSAKYFFLMWNCLWKGGASIVHGHMQMTLGRGMHYARVEHWRRQAKLYELAHGENYFEDLYRAHAALGLAREIGKTRVLASLTPVKDKELLLISPTRWIDHSGFKDAISDVLQTYSEELGVQSFNLALFQRPIDVAETTRWSDGAKGWEDWDGFPAMVRIVDRGDLQVRSADVGCMELYASSVIASDPFEVIGAFS
jgi:galactose-1-phosphate uridylyltransferase